MLRSRPLRGRREREDDVFLDLDSGKHHLRQFMPFSKTELEYDTQKLNIVSVVSH